ncbi:unnamed protein product [Caenorhabditis auriculariae]|uniref:UNC93-like protein MFSD11 n=1 Tax=Caenorhabditis auriculariae TaxID=2777116 RepID=A0A8S1GZ04_9PELO|nr:unnamed protein product [Caenorhabditis auriculariae]
MITLETRNVIQLGAGMFFVFFAFTTQGFIVQTVLENRHKEDPSIPKEAGYYSQTIIYGTFIFSCIISPVVVAYLTPKWSLVLGSSGYTIYMAGFTFLNPYFLFISAAWEGLWAGALWTGMGQYLAINSTEKTLARNSGLVWLIYSSSFLVGGVFLLVMFKNYNTDTIDMEMTRILYGTFAGVSLAGNICFALLPNMKKEKEESISVYWNEFREAIFLLIEPQTILLIATFAYSGIELSYWSGVYSNSLSNTKTFPVNTNILMALNQMAVGCGEIAGGLSIGVLGSMKNSTRRFWIIYVGATGCIIAYFISFMMLPGKSSFEETDELSYIFPNEYLALFGGFLLGLGDCCLNTQIYSIVPALFPNKTTQAFAVHKFFHATLSTICMFYGSVLVLPWQLLILLIFCLLSCATFTVAEIKYSPKNQKLKSDTETEKSHL